MFGSDIRERSCEPEILDGLTVAEDVRERCYDDLARMRLEQRGNRVAPNESCSEAESRRRVSGGATAERRR